MAEIKNSTIFENSEDILLPADVLVVLVKTEWNAIATEIG